MTDVSESTNSDRPAAVAAIDLMRQTLGDYQIIGRLGSGGMGEVYLAEQISLKRRVALKVLRQDLASDENYLRRFNAEATAVAPISHPGIVSVYGIGEHNGIHYIALEYVQGITLREHIRRKGRLSYEECLVIMEKVSSAPTAPPKKGLSIAISSLKT